MRVLMLGWEYPPHLTGGLGTACEGLTRALAEEGERILFVLPRVAGDEAADHMDLTDGRIPGVAPAPAGVVQVVLDAALSPYDRPEAWTARRAAGGEPGADAGAAGRYGGDLVGEVVRYGERVAALAARGGFDLIHAHDWMTFPAALAARRVSGRPVVLHVHSLEPDRSGGGVDPAIDRIEGEALRAADLVVAVSHYTRDQVIRRHGVDPARVVVVHNGVTRAEAIRRSHLDAEAASGPPVVLFLGRITVQKGPGFFIEAARRVLPHAPDTRFVMAGSGDLLDAMRRRVEALGIAESFEFPGFLRGAERERTFALARVYVMPSVSEPFGITPLEAMASDVPVIISRQSGVAEVLRHALKVDFWDVDRLAELILAVLRHGPLGQELRRMAEREVETLHWRAAARKVRDVWRRLAGSGG